MSHYDYDRNSDSDNDNVIVDSDEVHDLVENLLRIFPNDLSVGKTEVSYKLYEGRFEISQWNHDETNNQARAQNL